ncbi:hypothetical protein Mp_1g16250 [Marchantia polymorpha subsp. ruderalis]|uniref:Uncharacterized protein n=2 Tax=Marchantia polymorpha TaxID=3197 RepID=A0AAF6AQR9_MARPO|nr:hypothetical protein MARPO_0033s0035 [Marchantia polymorpha]BBM98789.1 hypothetical protein Mp_1g16250 [Marchantia polymorpha subsp. ruderalis]|eukprot:PTQ41614.1 hypothetical protein MARPO_0033s0035 [Marchantia polymorpha]
MPTKKGRRAQCQAYTSCKPCALHRVTIDASAVGTSELPLLSSQSPRVAGQLNSKHSSTWYQRPFFALRGREPCGTEWLRGLIWRDLKPSGPFTDRERPRSQTNGMRNWMAPFPSPLELWPGLSSPSSRLVCGYYEENNRKLFMVKYCDKLRPFVS